MNLNALSFSRIIIAAIALSLLPPTVYARSKKLVEPAPVTISCNLTDTQMKSGIRSGGAARNWVVVSQTPGNTELNYEKSEGKHSLTVNVSYTKNTFAVTYKDSFNLNYKVNRKGIRERHKKPISWMSNLSGDIQRFTDIECLEGSDEPNEPVEPNEPQQTQSKSELVQQCIDACTKATSKTPEACFDGCTD